MAFRFEVEDVFHITGRGTVATGTAREGELELAARIVILDTDGRELRRSNATRLEMRGEELDRIEAPMQAAILLRGIDRDDVARGMTIVRADEFDAGLHDQDDDRDDDPISADELPQLEPVALDTPLLLLPLRIETRFRPGRIRIRAWPDDIHIDAFEERIADAERDLLARLAEVDGDEQTARFDQIAREIGVARARLLLDYAERGVEPDTVDELWTSRPMARALPERLIAVAETADGRRFSAAGGQIPAEGLPVGPAPGDDETVGAMGPMAWMADFDEAVRVGMAMELPLPTDVVRVERLSVFGVSPRPGADDVAALFRNHAYTRGLDVHPPLAPTKGPGNGPWDSQRGPGPVTALAEALGAERDALALPDDVVDPSTLERAARTVVWEGAVRPAVILGFGLSDALREGSDDASVVDAVRRRYIDELDAYGPFPTLRIGDQPYGILPVTPIGQLARTGMDAALVGHGDVAAPFADTAEARRRDERREGGWSSMLRALSRHPTGRDWRARALFPGPLVSDWLARSGAVNEPAMRGVVEALRRSLGEVGVSLAALGAPRKGMLGDSAFSSRTFRLCGPLVEEGADVPPGGEATSSRLTPNYVQALLDGDLDERRPPEAPLPVLRQLAEAALLQVLGDVASLKSETTDLPGADARTEPEAPSRRRGLVADQFGSLGPVDELIGRAGSESGERAAHATALGAALKRLGAAPPAAIHAAVAAALDLAAFRIDAWLTSFATEELRALRARSPRTLAVGAWGVVEALAPDDAPDVQPFVLAPTMDHAGTAALLHQARAGLDRDAPGLLSLDLSSATVRAARRLSRALRKGADIAEALGSMASEALRDAGQAAWLPDVAAAYPLREGVRPEAGDVSDPAGAAARTGRIDGLALLRGGADPTASSSEAPRPPVDDLRAALDGARGQLRTAIGGLRDLLLAEGAHALAQGRPEAAAAALDGLGAGAPPPDRFDVAEPVRSADSLAFGVALLTPPDADVDTDDGMVSDPVAQVLPGLAALMDDLVGRPIGSLEVTGIDEDDNQVREFVGIDRLGLSTLGLALLCRPGADALEVLGTRAIELAEVDTGSAIAGARVEATRPLEDTLWAAARAGELLGTSRPLTALDVSDPERPPLKRPEVVYEVPAEQRATSELVRIRDLLVQEATSVEAALASESGEPVLAGVRAALGEAHVLGFSSAGYTAGERHDAGSLAGRARAVADALTGVLDEAAGEAAGRRLPVLLPNVPLPGVANTDPADWDGGLKLDGTSPTRLAAWLEQSQRVRPRVAPLADLLMAGGDERVSLRVAQWPARQPTTSDPVDWIGGQPEAKERHTGHSSVLACGLARDVSGPSAVSGVVVDGWEEALPAGRATMGIAARAPAPPARAPQTALLAVPPGADTEWTSSMLAELIGHTVDMARARTIDLRELPGVIPGNPAGVDRRFDGLGWLLPLLWIADHETDFRDSGCDPLPEREDLP